MLSTSERTTVDIDPVSRDGLADAAVTQIRSGILEGRLKPGSHLGEVELSKSLGVSRAPVREALLRLEQEGLVTSPRYRGAKVVDLTANDIEELVTLRSALESTAWSIGCARASDKDLSELEDCVEQMRSAVGRRAYPELVRMDIEFHDRAVQAAGHQRLYAAWSAIKWQVALYLLNRQVVVDDYHKIIVAEHAQLVIDLREGDADKAARTIKEHISTAYERLQAGALIADPAAPVEDDKTQR